MEDDLISKEEFIYMEISKYISMNNKNSSYFYSLCAKKRYSISINLILNFHKNLPSYKWNWLSEGVSNGLVVMWLLQGGARIPNLGLLTELTFPRVEGSASLKSRSDPPWREKVMGEKGEYCRSEDLKDEKKLDISVQVEGFSP